MVKELCPYCVAPPDCFTKEEHDPMESCPKCDTWAKEVGDPHPECEETAILFAAIRGD